MFEDDDIESGALMEEAYKTYSKILSEAIRTGQVDDPFRMVGLFLGLNIAENIMYQKLLDSGCTIESIEKSKKKVERISHDIIAKVRGKFVQPIDEEEV
jgi:hypothetical protein